MLNLMISDRSLINNNANEIINLHSESFELSYFCLNTSRKVYFNATFKKNKSFAYFFVNFPMHVSQ